MVQTCGAVARADHSSPLGAVLVNQEANLLWLIETVVRQTAELRMALQLVWTVLQLALLVLLSPLAPVPVVLLLPNPVSYQ